MRMKVCQMNIHGQVDILIQEASAVEKLCQMYGGWAGIYVIIISKYIYIYTKISKNLNS